PGLGLARRWKMRAAFPGHTPACATSSRSTRGNSNLGRPSRSSQNIPIGSQIAITSGRSWAVLGASPSFPANTTWMLGGVGGLAGLPGEDLPDGGRGVRLLGAAIDDRRIVGHEAQALEGGIVLAEHGQELLLLVGTHPIGGDYGLGSCLTHDGFPPTNAWGSNWRAILAGWLSNAGGKLAFQLIKFATAGEFPGAYEISHFWEFAYGAETPLASPRLGGLAALPHQRGHVPRESLPDLGRRSRHRDPVGLEGRDLVCRRALAAGDDRARMPHPLPGRSVLAGDEGHHRLRHRALDELRRLLLG